MIKLNRTKLENKRCVFKICKKIDVLSLLKWLSAGYKPFYNLIY